MRQTEILLMNEVMIEKPFCPACASTKVSSKAERQEVNIWLCNFCDLEFATASNKLESGDVIDTDPDFFHGLTESFETQLSKAHNILPKRLEVYARILGRPIRSVMEVGCATGAYGKAFDRLGIRYRAIEIEKEMARQAKLNTGLDIICGNFMDTDEEDCFDLFFCSQVLEHVPAPQLFIEKAARIARNGLVHVDVPNHDSLAANIRKWADTTNYGFIQPPYHMIAYNKRSLSALFNRGGIHLDVIKAFRNDHDIYGQLGSNYSVTNKIRFAAADFLGMGSLLTAIGRPSI